MSDVAFGKYRLIAELGHGGMADVYLAVARGPAGFSKLVVIKRVRDNLVDDPEFRSMLVDEALLAGRLNHPNVVQTNEVAQIGEQFFIAMEYLEGQPLHRILHRATLAGFPFALHVRVLADALAGLHHAHELKDYDGTPLNVVHRDATPQNIFVTYEGHVKVVDFGIAKAANRSSETRSGIIKGKVVYMSPEQAMGADVDRRADVFSVGVMLWQAATGQRMWQGLEELTVMQRLIGGEIPFSPREVNPECPEAFDRIVQKALAFDREARYATAAELQKDLELFLRQQGTPTGIRELGDYVSQLFKDRRAHQTAIVERQLAALKSKEPELFRHDHGTPSEASREVSPVSLSVSGTPSRTLQHGAWERGADAVPEPTVTVPAIPSRRSKGRLTGLVATAIAVTAGIVWATSVRQQMRAPTAAISSPEPASSPVPSPADAPAAAPAQPRETPMMTLTLSATPPEARFRVDGGEPVANPSATKLPSDGKQHMIEIFAPNYVAKSISVAFTNDRDIRESLEKATTTKPVKTAPPPRRVRAQPAPRANAATAAPAPSPPPSDGVDLSSSW